MNNKILLFFTLSAFGATNIIADNVIKKPIKIAKKSHKALAKPFKPCKCYCSVICKARDSKPGDPIIYSKKFKRCFCAERDVRLFKKNKCHLKPNPKSINCCKVKRK